MSSSPDSWPTRPRHAGPPAHGPLPPPGYNARSTRAPSSESGPGSSAPPSGRGGQGVAVSAGWWPEAADPELTQPTKTPPHAPPTQPRPGRTERPTVSAWLFVAVLVALVSTVAVLGFVTPGYFVTTVFDQAAVQNGVRTILRDEYRLRVSEVVCPPNQQVLPARSFTCVATIDGRRSEVPVVIQDRDGRYRVGQPR
jgi:hypothetical protein